MVSMGPFGLMMWKHQHISLFRELLLLARLYCNLNVNPDRLARSLLISATELLFSTPRRADTCSVWLCNVVCLVMEAMLITSGASRLAM